MSDRSLSPFEQLGTAIRARDVAAAGRILADHPDLKRQLDQPMPGGDFGATALLTAVSARDRAMVELLLAHGADINARSHWWAGGFGVLDREPDDLTAWLIEQGAVVDAYAAARVGDVGRLRSLLAADPGAARMRGGDGQTPLHVAASVEIAAMLVEAGADMDARDVDHESTPAQYLVRDRPDVARYLVDRGARTDLLLCAALGDLERARRHLDDDPASAGITVSAKWLPMRDPRAGGHIYRWTLAAYASPHRIAHEFGHAAVVALLFERSPADVALAGACEIGDAVRANAITAAHPQLTASLSAELARRLPDAAETDRTIAVALMLEAGWPVDVRGEHGATALHWASWNGNLALLNHVLRHAPPLEVTDTSYGGTPLGWAIYGSTNGWRCQTGDYAGVVKALLAAGAAPPAEHGGSDAVRAAVTGTT